MEKTALIILDVQRGNIDRFQGAIDTMQYLNQLATVISTAHSAHIPIIHVTTNFRPGYPEASSRNASTSRAIVTGMFTDSHPSSQIHPVLPQSSSDIRVVKRRISAFHGTDLELVIKAMGVDNLVIAGLTTSGSVLSTVRQAADMDYNLTVLADLCKDPAMDVHHVLMGKVLPRQAVVYSSWEWMANLHSNTMGQRSSFGASAGAFGASPGAVYTPHTGASPSAGFPAAHAHSLHHGHHGHPSTHGGHNAPGFAAHTDPGGFGGSPEAFGAHNDSGFAARTDTGFGSTTTSIGDHFGDMSSIHGDTGTVSYKSDWDKLAEL